MSTPKQALAVISCGPDDDIEDAMNILGSIADLGNKYFYFSAGGGAIQVFKRESE